MFGKLKQKLKEFTDSVSKKVDEKAVTTDEQIFDQSAETDVEQIVESAELVESVSSVELSETEVAEEDISEKVSEIESKTKKETETRVDVEIDTATKTDTDVKDLVETDSDKTETSTVDNIKESEELKEELQKEESAKDSKGSENHTFVSKFKSIFSGKKHTLEKKKEVKSDEQTDGKFDEKHDDEHDEKVETDVIKTESFELSSEESDLSIDSELDLPAEETDVLISDQSVAVSAATNATTIEGADEKPKKHKKAGIFDKAKSLIFSREVILNEKDIEDPLFELEMALLESDLALSVSEAIIKSVKEELVGSHKKIGKNTGEFIEDALKNAILKVMSANVFDLDEFIKSNEGRTIHLAFVGINGTGKTTSIAKLAHRFKSQGYSVVIAAGDTFRAGAIDQIQIHADRLGVKLIRHHEGSDPAAVIYDALQYAKSNNIDILLSDTAGRMHTNVNLMTQLEKICRVSSPDLVIFVDEATAGNDAVERASQYSNAVRIDGSILTKLDADSKGGAAISIAYITQKPILFFGMGQGYDDLMKFDPEWFINKLFED